MVDPIAAAASRRRGRPIVAGTAIGVGLAAVVVLIAVRPVRAPTPDRIFQDARTDLAAGEPARARAGMVRLAGLRAPTEFDHLLRAQIDEALGRPDEALAELGSIADDHPLGPIGRLLAGQVEMKRHRLRPAEAHFLAAIRLEPRSVKPRRELVYLYNLQQRQRDLDATLDAMSRFAPLEFGYVLHWTETRNVVWNPERDSEALALCVAADPTDRTSRLALARGLRQMTRPAEARAVLAPLPPDDPDARAVRALIALDLGDQAEFDRLLASAPADDRQLARARGGLALQRGDPAAAVRHFRDALASDPTDRVTLFGLGNALRLAGDPAAAATYLDAARRHDAITPLISLASTPAGARDPSLPARLGQACEAAGRLLEARAWYGLAVARDPLDPTSQAALFRLDPDRASPPRPAPASNNMTSG